MTGTIRAYTRIVCIFTWLFLMFTFRIVCMPLTLFSPTANEALRRSVMRVFSKGALLLLGIRIEIRGNPPFPPYLLASNHLAVIDVLVLGSILGPIFISQGAVAAWPFIGWVTRATETIFIDRKKLRDVLRVNQLIADKLDAGNGIVIFPEATTSEGLELLPFKPALFEAPIQANRPVHYASLSYESPPGAPSAIDTIVWHDGVSFMSHFMRLATLRRSKAIVVFCDRPITAGDRRILAREVQEAVQSGRLPME